MLTGYDSSYFLPSQHTYLLIPCLPAGGPDRGPGRQAIQDEITMNIISALQVKLTEGEQARIYGKGTDNLEAYLKVMEANWIYSKGTKEQVTKARQLSEEAISLDPNYALP